MVLDGIAHAEQADGAHLAVDLAWDLGVALPGFGVGQNFLANKAGHLIAHLAQMLWQRRRIWKAELAGAGPVS